jgi:hypothetical protein
MYHTIRESDFVVTASKRPGTGRLENNVDSDDDDDDAKRQGGNHVQR